MFLTGIVLFIEVFICYSFETEIHDLDPGMVSVHFNCSLATYSFKRILGTHRVPECTPSGTVEPCMKMLAVQFV